jgi:hypothetical protein
MNYLQLIVLVLAVFILWRHLPAAILFLFPKWMRIVAAKSSDPGVDSNLFDRMESELAPLGFTRLGVYWEKGPLQRRRLVYNFVNDAIPAWASAQMVNQQARLCLFTSFDGGGLVLTCDHRRINVNCPQECLVGGLPEAEPRLLVTIHSRRVKTILTSGKAISRDLDMVSRVRRAKEWYSGYGARELRFRGFSAFLWSIAVLTSIIWTIYQFLKP